MPLGCGLAGAGCWAVAKCKAVDIRTTETTISSPDLTVPTSLAVLPTKVSLHGD